MLRGAHLPYHGPRTVASNGKGVYPPEGLRAVPLHPITTSLHTSHQENMKKLNCA